MPALNFIITTAGQNAMALAGSLGPVTIAHVAIGSGVWTPTAAATALHSQIKLLTVGGSTVPTPGTLHITASDESSDVYTVSEVGLYTSTGILFAVYSQSSPIFSKSSGSVSLIATDVVVTGATPGSVTVAGDLGFSYPPASESAPGVAQIATTSQVSDGTDNTTIVTPLKLMTWVSSLFLRATNNLSDLTNTTLARINLGLGTAATQNIPSSGNANSAQVVMGSDSRLFDQRTPTDGSVTASKMAAGAALSNLAFTPANIANNLSDLTNTTFARNNLGLGTAATQNVPASGNAISTQVVLGSDTRLTNALNKTGDSMTGALGMGNNPIVNCPTAAKAWACLAATVTDGGTAVSTGSPIRILNSFNIASAVRLENADPSDGNFCYLVTFINAMPSTYYAISACCAQSASGPTPASDVVAAWPISATQFIFKTWNDGGGAPAQPLDRIMFSIFG